MKKARVTFRKCIQDSQEYGSNNEYMVSRVFFDLEKMPRNGLKIKYINKLIPVINIGKPVT